MLKEAYDENSLAHVRVFEWYERSSEGRESTEDDQCPCRPVSVSNPQKVTTTIKVVRRDRCIRIRMVVETVNANKGTVRKNFHVCSKLVPNNLTPYKKIVPQQIWLDIFMTIDNEAELMEYIITCDDSIQL